jgi:hypothetical protein
VFVTYFSTSTWQQTWRLAGSSATAKILVAPFCDGNPVPWWDITNPIVVIGIIVNTGIVLLIGLRLTTGRQRR